MGKIYIKTIGNRKYKYERISTKRVGDKVVTKDKYIGAVKPIQGAIDNMSKAQKDGLKGLWTTGGSSDALVARVIAYTSRKYAKNTVEKWCRKHFGVRPKTRKF